ncbi:aminoacyl-tRNA hydrolase [Taylorella equigenitalis]|uniref:Peptidyl-tRNA hydrolase n=1 Tax=Taylorella equigenitalis 14/56 TaxID=1091497 RepID=I7JKL8_9BURK|nr:aminoacyl-tRNA hydrolase [Taylorella equigenitalis]ASY41834.1 aminoacyl-tRNA hydrolase [Taylorella equigenitalis]WDU46703.1 aminoacyl-tRNA hydrolase [Taylorella equigenitalis]WDU49697.1 aminoacyl-tRNA hydrolase [Taylorella equigenitalis]WDU53675.1 aminoacyl-tRNA hydrolase [Taylorella equigenitalis]CCG18490.1 peptidyl-tRNA hydrolase [Taylorella equigenitalis 14/56]
MNTSLKLIVGLGNPGPEYEHTRHNAGFWFVDRLALKHGCNWNQESAFHGYMAKMPSAGGSIFLLKPSTYMNLSGRAVQAVCHFYKIAVDEVLVAHDELDLPINEIKLKKGGGHAGHNGLRDITKAMASPEFWRLRIGIDHPRKRNMVQPVADYVLHRPNLEEFEQLLMSVDRGVEAMDYLIKGDKQKAIATLSVGNASCKAKSEAQTQAQSKATARAQSKAQTASATKSASTTISAPTQTPKQTQAPYKHPSPAKPKKEGTQDA